MIFTLSKLSSQHTLTHLKRGQLLLLLIQFSHSLFESEQFSNSIHEFVVQVSTTKGTGGDVIILEEAAYCDPGFFYETVAPLLLIGRTSLLGISTLTSEINFYSRLIKMKDPNTQACKHALYTRSISCKQVKHVTVTQTKKTGTNLQNLQRGACLHQMQG